MKVRKHRQECKLGRDFCCRMMAHLYRRFLYLLVSRGADPSVPSRQTYVLTAIYR